MLRVNRDRIQAHGPLRTGRKPGAYTAGSTDEEGRKRALGGEAAGPAAAGPGLRGVKSSRPQTFVLHSLSNKKAPAVSWTPTDIRVSEQHRQEAKKTWPGNIVYLTLLPENTKT